MTYKSVKQVATETQLSEATIRTWARARRFTSYRPGGKIMIDPESFRQFIERSKDTIQKDPDVRKLLSGLSRSRA